MSLETKDLRKVGGAMTDDIVLLPPSRIAAKRLEAMHVDLFVQAECHDVRAAAPLVHSYGVGVVYSVRPGRRKVRRGDCAAAVAHTRRFAPDAEILLDASLYTGKNRKLGQDPPTRDWVRLQRDLGLSWAVTDSGYCGQGDVRGIVRTLMAAERLGDNVIAALPIASRWLTDDASTLAALIDRYSVPVALMVEDEADPFDLVGAVEGLVEVLAARTPVLLLRSDTAAIGALAYGAAAAAVGTTSTYRHIYPISSGGGPPHLSYVVPKLLGYFLNSRVENAYRLNGSLHAWQCTCRYCDGSRDLTWIASSAKPFESAFQHSVAALAEIGYQLTEAVGRGVEARLAWSQMCTDAQQQHYTVRDISGGVWQPKQSLAEWIRITPTPVAV